MALPGPIEKAWQEAQQRQNESAPPPAPGVDDEQQAVDEQAPDIEERVEPAPQPEEDWKKRFVSYKQSTDTTIHELRQLLAKREADRAAQTHQIEQMQQQIAELRQAAPQNYLPQGVLSQEDVEILGEENVQRIAKLAQAQVERIKREQEDKLNALYRKVHEREQLEVQSQAKKAEQDFWEKVKGIVPEASEIDVDPRFSDFLNTREPNSGKTWRELGFAAKQAWDVERLANIYARFQEANKPKSREEEVVPRGAAGGNAPSRSTNGKIWTRQEYERAVMDSVRGGPPTPDKMKQVDKLHAEFLQALREGRVR